MEGTPFGRYRLIELMGRGGMGEVWRAYDTDTDRVVALKILPTEISNDNVFQQRFRREAHATARLNSPHLIPIHTYGEINGRLFVDMRLIEGHDLETVLSHGPLPPDRAVHIIGQTAKALHAAHKDGLLHRDVKPSNIMIDADDFAYLIDFGIARAAGDLALTKVGDVIGTYHYMAPERFSGDNADARSDVYSLACVLYECLTAQSPFPGNTLEQQIGGHLRTPPPRPSSTIPELPAGLDSVIAKGMAKHPNDRYSTAVEFAQAAQSAMTMPIPTRVPPPVRTQPANNPYHVHFDTRSDGRGLPQRPPPQTPPPQPPPPPSPPPPSPRQLDPTPTMARPVPPVYSPPRPEPAARPPATPPKPARPWWRRKAVAITAALLAVVVAIVTVVFVNQPSPKGDEFEQVTLPFTGLRDPQGLSVDSGGTVYVADTPKNRILALFAGANEPVVLPFEGLNYPTGVTADNTGTVYVNDAGNKRVLVLRSGSQKQEVLQFHDLGNPTGLSVDGSRTVYVTDTANNRVVALAAGSNAQTEVPFTGLSAPTGLVVNSGGTVYVSDGGNNRVLMLPTDTKKQVALPFTGLKQPGGVTLDSQGAVYVTDTGNSRTLKLPAGSSTQEELHFTGLQNPWGLAVDNVGTVYVGGRNNQIVALRKK
ncbi:serine/threonine-protein kinase PknD [Mycobacterium asiaticum]|uniref:serine/threonine-protein kinase PknD n=2 Tax=Mycobacterium asiaticum TaxID=1790 RepID=UPI000564BCE3|nr:serine/threonine-protein kinase PknD [Mycobacterium asiaticum]